MKLHDLGAVFLRDFDRAIPALRINDKDFVGPPYRIEAFSQVRGFVLDGNEQGNGHTLVVSSHGSGKGTAGRRLAGNWLRIFVMPGITIESESRNAREVLG